MVTQCQSLGLGFDLATLICCAACTKIFFWVRINHLSESVVSQRGALASKQQYQAQMNCLLHTFQ